MKCRYSRDVLSSVGQNDAQMTIRQRECPIPGHASCLRVGFDETQRVEWSLE